MSYSDEVLADNPEGYWRCDEASGTLVDFTGDERDFTVVAGTAGYEQTSPITTDPSDFAILLSGDDEFSTGDSPSFDLGDGPLSIECWVRRQSTGSTQGILTKGANAYQIYFSSGNAFVLGKDGVGNVVSSTTTITDTSTWHHLVATKTGATSLLYIDGSDVTGSITDQTLANNSVALFLGSGGGGLFLNAYIDEVAVYSSVLSAARVLVHYEAATTADELVGIDWVYV